MLPNICVYSAMVWARRKLSVENLEMFVVGRLRPVRSIRPGIHAGFREMKPHVVERQPRKRRGWRTTRIIRCVILPGINAGPSTA